jgi:hypothetical protein
VWHAPSIATSPERPRPVTPFRIGGYTDHEVEKRMSSKRDARVDYYRGVRDALNEHMATTEMGLRQLSGLSDAEKDKIVASVRKRHERLLKEVDRKLAEQQ